MPQENVSDKLSLVAGAAIAPYLRVKLVSGLVQIAGDELCIGTAYNRAYASGDQITVTDKRAPGTRIMIANGAIAAGASVTSAASGKVASGTAGVEDYGIALTAASVDGEQIEVLLNTT